MLILILVLAHPAPATLHHLGQVGGLLNSLFSMGEVGVGVEEGVEVEEVGTFLITLERLLSMGEREEEEEEEKIEEEEELDGRTNELEEGLEVLEEEDVRELEELFRVAEETGLELLAFRSLPDHVPCRWAYSSSSSSFNLFSSFSSLVPQSFHLSPPLAPAPAPGPPPSTLHFRPFLLLVYFVN